MNFSQYWWQFLLVAVVSYAIGGVNFAIIFSKSIKHRDIRTVGSGNAGTTNVFRTFGLRMGAITFVCDTLKGVIPCLACKFIFANTGFALDFQYWAGAFAVLGHILPCMHNFRGGKGVSTSMGACIVVQPMLMLYCILPICIVTFFVDRMSVTSLLFAIFWVTWHWTVLRGQVGIFACVTISCSFALVIFSHRHNIVRIFTGKEPRTGLRRKLLRKDKRENKRLRAEMQEESLRFVEPSERYLASYAQACEDCSALGEKVAFPSESVLLRAYNFKHGINLPEGGVPSTVLWLVRGDEFIGCAEIRHKLPEGSAALGGQIDFAVRCDKRGQGYGTMILRLALIYAKQQLGITRVLLTCSDVNPIAARVIEKNGGKFAGVIADDGATTKRYWIDIK